MGSQAQHAPKPRSAALFLTLLGWLVCAISLSRAEDNAPPAGRDYVLFESGQTRPLALRSDGQFLYVTNTPDARVEIFAASHAGLHHVQSVPVGLEPVALALNPDETQLWVVNHLSDSLSVIDVSSQPARVVNTLWVGDEPADLVFAGPDLRHVYVSTAHRGQNSPEDPQNLTPGIGRAKIWVFDADAPGAQPGGSPLQIITLFGDAPRALARSADGARVYAGIFKSGNRTTVLPPAAIAGVPKAPPNASDDGVAEPNTGLIVQHNGQHWVDELNRSYDALVGLRLPDQDVFEIDAMASPATQKRAVAGVGTVLFSMAVHPHTGEVFVSNLEANNPIRFAGENRRGTGSLKGRLTASRISVVAEDGVQHTDLNSHLADERQPDRPETLDKSLFMPLQMQFSEDGQTLYLVAFGSDKLVRLSVAALRSGEIQPDPADHLLLTGGGPSGLVIDAQRRRVYVHTRFDNGVSVVDIDAFNEHSHLRMHNPEPPSVTAGRPFLYNATLTSGFGNDACASCHIFGDNDALAWDLGDPDGAVQPVVNDYHPQSAGHPGLSHRFHPMKGPMTTQTLRGLPRHGPMHWRGDRSGAMRSGDETLEAAAFKEFNEAFTSLLARTEPLSAADMQKFTDFALQLTHPPNPLRRLDNGLTEQQQAGAELYHRGVLRSNGVREICATCHPIDPAAGVFGTTGQMAFNDQPGEKDFKIPHFRDQYRKIGLFTTGSAFPRDQIRGFAFNHNGATSVNALFAEFGVSNHLTAQLKEFLFVFPSESAPILGQQLDITAERSAAAEARLQLLIERARVTEPVPECDLVLTAQIDDIERQWLLHRESGRWRADDGSADAPLDALDALIEGATEPAVLTCVPWGSGPRMALDRDGDGVFNGLELAQGSDPADASSSQFRPATGLWYDPDRNGSGWDIEISGANLSAVWYTHAADGTPRWYLASGPMQQHWQAPLLRMQWDAQNNTASASEVGEVRIDFTDPRTADLFWQLDGHSGQRRIEKLMFSEQAVHMPMTGLWYDADEPGWGLSLDTQGDARVAVVYHYDALGQPLWSIATSANGVSAARQTLRMHGACPTCQYRPSLASENGALNTEVMAFDRIRLLDLSLQDATGAVQWQRRNRTLIRLSDAWR